MTIPGAVGEEPENQRYLAIPSAAPMARRSDNGLLHDPAATNRTVAESDKGLTGVHWPTRARGRRIASARRRQATAGGHLNLALERVDP